MKLKSFAVNTLLAAAIFTTGCAENPADKVPSAGVTTPSVVATATASPDATPAAQSGTVYTFSPDSEVGFVGSKVTGSHEGGFKSVKGSVSVPDGSVDQAMIDFTIDMKSLHSDDEKLTGHLASEDFFDVATFPEATFKSSSLASSDDGYTVTGDLTLHGVTKSITFPATISVEEDALKTQAEFSINRKDFDIVYKGKPDDLIRDEVVIKFDLTGNKEA